MSEVEKIRERIKRKLHGYIDREFERKQLEKQIEQLRATIESPKNQAMDGMPRGSGGGDAMASLVGELVDLQERYKTKMRHLIVAQAEVEELIDSLEPVERSLMRFRYIEGMPWETVCVVMNYSWRQTHRIHSKVLDRLVEMEMEGLRSDIVIDELSTETDSAPIYARAIAGTARHT